MPRMLLSGNEAIAWGFRDAGGHFAAAYPGTPSTEILEAIAPFPEVYAQWSPNEKAAFESAFGASLAGARVLVAMKHVGLNVAADPLFTSAYTGINGGMVIVSADDPSMHSSQNEQDNRNYAAFAKIPLLEPSDPQECYDFVGLGLEVSEKYDIPVLLRSETRLSHGKARVHTKEGRTEVPLREPDLRWDKYVMMPVNARPRRVDLAKRLSALAEFSESGGLNRLEFGDRKIGIITSGISYMYAKEVFPEASYLKLGMSYPFPEKLVRTFAEEILKAGGTIYIVEELDPFIEMKVKALGIPCRGKELIPEIGELSPEIIRRAIKGETYETKPVSGAPSRPPNLCPGCPHTSVFFQLNRLKANVFGDIGCYTLGALPPLSSIYTCICMGASVTNAFGFAKARGGDEAKRTVAVIGDSTFFHMGVPGLMEMVYNKGVNTLIVLDNRTTAMTGHQVHPGSGKTLKGEETVALLPEEIAKAMGVNHIQVIDPYDLRATREAIKGAMAHDGPSVLVTRRACVLLPEERKRWEALPKFVVVEDRCAGERCHLCLRLGCPAIFVFEGKARIDRTLCTSCSLCAQVCPKTYNAIFPENELSEVKDA
ncbi:MAG: indolepyruvate ferredoxin oxidoreductase subunit alpha [candidate division WOR-3 bacterium]